MYLPRGLALEFIRKKNPAFHLSGDGAQHFDQATLSNNGRLD